MQVSNLITQLGGPEALARKLGEIRPARRISRDAIYMWQFRKRIPDAWHAGILQLAQGHGIELTPSELAAFGDAKNEAA